jgi:CRP-like cAMP-binding protein
MPTTSCPCKNQLLAALPNRELTDLLTDLELVDLAVGKVLRAPGSISAHVYFPTTALASVIYISDGGDLTEVIQVGKEGCIGILGLLGGNSAPTTTIVQCAGRAYRIGEQRLRALFEHCGSLQTLFLRYIQTVVTQISQAGPCNRHHSVAQRYCRMLMQTFDQMSGGEISMTHEQFAHRLAVRRESVTDAARDAQRLGLISYRRGRIILLDPGGLAARACECYGLIKREHARLLPSPLSTGPCDPLHCEFCSARARPGLPMPYPAMSRAATPARHAHLASAH